MVEAIFEMAASPVVRMRSKEDIPESDPKPAAKQAGSLTRVGETQSDTSKTVASPVGPHQKQYVGEAPPVRTDEGSTDEPMEAGADRNESQQSQRPPTLPPRVGPVTGGIVHLFVDKTY